MVFSGGAPRGQVKPVAVFAIVAVVCLAAIVVGQGYAPSTAAGAAVVSVAAVWMFLTRRPEVALLVLMLYVGVLDGYLRLRTDQEGVTLVRDALLYSLAAGVFLRRQTHGGAREAPPVSVAIVVLALLTLVQVLNPANGSLGHSLASVRPHLEFLPLFYLGFVLIRTRARLRAVLVILVAVTAVNGIVGYVQFGLTPEQLADWGPGYSSRIYGTGDVSGRVFVDSSGVRHVRPFALGGDSGFGGYLGFLAAPAALVLLAFVRRSTWRVLAIPPLIAVALAVLTSQSRSSLLATIFALAVFAAMAVASQRSLRAVVGLGAAVLIVFFTISSLNSNSQAGDFDRYRTIAPGQVVGTSLDYRRANLRNLGTYASRFPLGAGIGSAGAAVESYGAPGRNVGLDAESEFTYAVIELGIPGLLLLLGLTIWGLRIALTRVRRIPDDELRMLLAGIAAPLAAIAISWFAFAVLAKSPTAPYFWFALGILAFWLRKEPTVEAPSPTAPQAAAVT